MGSRSVAFQRGTGVHVVPGEFFFLSLFIFVCEYIRREFFFKISVWICVHGVPPVPKSQTPVKVQTMIASSIHSGLHNSCFLMFVLSFTSFLFH